MRSAVLFMILIIHLFIYSLFIAANSCTGAVVFVLSSLIVALIVSCRILFRWIILLLREAGEWFSSAVRETH